jgi:hypothetical protein
VNMWQGLIFASIGYLLRTSSRVHQERRTCPESEGVAQVRLTEAAHTGVSSR